MPEEHRSLEYSRSPSTAEISGVVVIAWNRRREALRKNNPRLGLLKHPAQAKPVWGAFFYPVGARQLPKAPTALVRLDPVQDARQGGTRLQCPAHISWTALMTIS